MRYILKESQYKKLVKLLNENTPVPGTFLYQTLNPSNQAPTNTNVPKQNPYFFQQINPYLVDCSNVAGVSFPVTAEMQKSFAAKSGLNPNSPENKIFFCDTNSMNKKLAEIGSKTQPNAGTQSRQSTSQQSTSQQKTSDSTEEKTLGAAGYGDITKIKGSDTDQTAITTGSAGQSLILYSDKELRTRAGGYILKGGVTAQGGKVTANFGNWSATADCSKLPAENGFVYGSKTYYSTELANMGAEACKAQK